MIIKKIYFLSLKNIFGYPKIMIEMTLENRNDIIEETASSDH